MKTDLNEMTSGGRQDIRMPWQRILVPIDFSKTSLHALDVAVPLARDCEAELLILNAIEPDPYASGMEGVVLAAPIATLEADARRNLSRIAERFVPESLSAEILVEHGRAMDVIVEVAKTKRVDLIVLTTHGRSGLDHVLMGSIAERVVRHAPCAVYVVRGVGRHREKQLK
jgi:nucleotide-binding universal stress UspA family protein